MPIALWDDVAAASSTRARSSAAETWHHAIALPLSPATTRALGWALGALWLLLAMGAVASLALEFGLGTADGIATFLNLGTEQGPGTWVAAVLHLSCAALAAVGAATARLHGPRWRSRWWLLAATFTFLSFDEVAALHDRTTDTLRYALGGATGVLHYAWVVPFLGLGLAFGLVQVRFLRHLGPTGRALVVAGAVFVAGAAGLEMVEGVLASDGGRGSGPYEVIVAVEELLELAGVMLAMTALSRHLVAVLGRPVLVLRAGELGAPCPSGVPEPR